MSRLFISAARKSSGKTSISIGLCAALRHRGLRVQPFKKGPDYIDPHWLALASARPCYNLDFYTMERDEILQMVASRSADADISLCEGNKGLYDGLDLDGSNSNAAMAELLHTPVLLVLDARGMTRGIAPLILGYQAFDKNIDIRGVILNRLGGFRHESKLRDVIEHYTDVKVIGAVHQDARFDIEERHLGLVPGHEDNAASVKITQLREAVQDQVDLDSLIDIAADAPQLPSSMMPEIPAIESTKPVDVRIGVVKNAAFGFYYPDDIEALEQAGANLIDIDNITDTELTDIDGLFIGGGFPETHMQALEANHGFREQLKQAIDDGLPVYAECGGLMYLARSISWKNERHEMVGAIEGDIVMEDRPQGRGYAQLLENPQSLWSSPTGNVIPCHEFHYSRFINLDKSARFAFRVLRGTGIDGINDGYIRNNMLACYIHQRSTRNNHWAQRFVAFVRQTRKLKPQT